MIPRLIRLTATFSLAVAAGCSPSFYRADADRQVLTIVKEQQGKTVGYAPAISVPTIEPTTLTKKSYEPVPTTTLPEQISNVVTTTPAPGRARRLGPDLDLGPQPTPTTQPDASAIDTVRRLSREPYVLGPDASIATSRRLGLFDSIGYAIEHSREYQGQMETLYLAALDVTLQRHLFEPRPFADVHADYDGGQRTSAYRSALSVTSEAGVRQQLPLGGEIVASGLVTFVDALNRNTSDGETAALALSGSIPFLRGAGFVNLEPLIQSERSVVYAVRAFETYRRNFAVSIASSYFTLLTQQSQLKNRYLRYLNSVDLTNRTEALFGAGKITSLEVQRAQQDLLEAEDDVNSALEAYENAVDQFKLRIGMPVDAPLLIVGIEVNVPVPKLEMDSAADLGRRFRLDLQTTRDRLEDARRRVDVAANQLLPDLNLTFGTGGGNPADGPASDLRGDTLTYNAGLRLDLPLDRVAERNRYRAALISLEAARRDVEQQEDQVAADVRQSIRGIRSAITSLELQRQGIEIAKKRLESANEFLLSGRTDDSRNVVEAQSSLLLAQDSFDSARANLQIAILSYLRDSGVLRLDPSTGELGMSMDRPTRTPAPPTRFTLPRQLPPTTQESRAGLAPSPPYPGERAGVRG